MVSPVTSLLNYQKHAGRIKIWQDYPDTNAFIPKRRTFFNVLFIVLILEKLSSNTSFPGKIT